MFEVEIKIKLKNKEEYVKKLKDLKGKYECNLIHTDIYYNMPKGLRSFEDSDEALRIRRSQEFIADNPISKDFISNSKKIKDISDFTYKGPKLDNLTKSRIEQVVKINNSENMSAILEVLGFRKVITVHKERIVYNLKYMDKEIEILVDKIQYLDGYYSELEIMCNSKKEMVQARDILFNLLKKLGHDKKDSIRRSYMELILEKK